MNKFKKLFNYYLSSYLNNSRTLNNLYSFLKIFFERNNKIDSTVASFGNVYRNSKWTNLQTQNIKKLFIKQWLLGAILISLFGLSIFVYNSTFYNFCYLLFFYVTQTLNEFLFNFYYIVGCFIYWLRLNLISFFLGNQYQHNTTLNQKTFSPKFTLNLNSQNINSQSNKLNYENLNTFFLYKTLSPLSQISIPCNLKNSSSLDKITFLSLSTKFNSKIYLESFINIDNSFHYNYNGALNEKFSSFSSLS